MSYDLLIGFKEKPQDLDSILSQSGFKLERNFDAGNLRCSSYEFYQKGKSHCPVELL